MGNLVPIQTQIETKNGEVLLTINLNLNIKLDAEALQSGSHNPISKKEVSDVKLPDMNSVRFEKPDIEDNSDIIEFGKQV